MHPKRTLPSRLLLEGQNGCGRAHAPGFWSCLFSFDNSGLDEFKASLEQDWSDDFNAIIVNLSVLAKFLIL